MTILLACLGSTGLFAFVQFLITRKDRQVDKRLEKIERDSVRTQMLIMLNHYPHEQTEILRLAQHYFVDLSANWYMTSIFNKWLEENNIGKPDWFNPND